MHVMVKQRSHSVTRRLWRCAKCTWIAMFFPHIEFWKHGIFAVIFCIFFAEVHCFLSSFIGVGLFLIARPNRWNRRLRSQNIPSMHQFCFVSFGPRGKKHERSRGKKQICHQHPSTKTSRLFQRHILCHS